MTVDANRVSEEALAEFREWTKTHPAKWNLSSVRVNGNFHHFADPETDTAWMGFEAAWNRRSPSLSGGEGEVVAWGNLHQALQDWRDEDNEDSIELPRDQAIGLCEEYRTALSSHQSVIAAKDAEIAELRALRERLRLEAQGHAGEARAANSTIYEIYQLLSGGKGEPGNWHGAEPARRYVEAAEARANAAVEAMTPSADTKAAYIGEFHMGVTLSAGGEEEYRRVQIPWTSIKEIMAAIKDRATLNGAKP